MEEIKKIVGLLKKGKIIIFPTDTVYGLGCTLNEESIKLLYKIKKRPKNKPALILVSSLSFAKKYGYFDSKTSALAQKIWPGPVTIIVKAKGNVPKLIQGKNSTIAIRVPKHQFLQKILNILNEPLLAPSANFSNGKPPSNLAQIDKNLIKLVDYVVTIKSGCNLPSTIIDMSSKNKEMSVIREGSIKIQDLKGVIK